MPDQTDLPDPSDFDVDEWLAGAPPARVIVVPVTLHKDVMARVGALLADKSDALVRAVAEGPRRLAQADPGQSEAAKIDALVAELMAELDGSWRYVHIRALTPVENNDVIASSTDKMAQIVAALTTSATLSAREDQPGKPLPADKWASLMEKVGVAQSMELNNAITELTFERVTPDFSRRVLSSLAGPDSALS